MVKLIFELKKDQYHKVLKLLSQVDIQINCLGVINQDIDGKIWVDNVSNPKTAMLIDNIWVIYLLGSSENQEFNIEAGKIIRNYIFPRKIADVDVDREWVLNYYSDSWISKIESELKLVNWFHVDIWHYKHADLKYSSWREQIPEGYKVEKVDEEFLSRTYLKNHEKITNWIYQRWKTPLDYFNRGFCFCLIKEDKEIVSRARADWSTENYILMHIITDESYLRQGYATIVTAAAAEYCKQKDIDLRWFCVSDNIASWKTAEKVGFQKIGEQRIIIGEFN